MPKPCIECGARPKLVGRHRCIVCYTRSLPIGEQVLEARRRLSLVPPELRRKRVPERQWPAGTRWCAGCQSFVDLADVPKGSGRCRACASAAIHSAHIERTYGLSAEEYDALLVKQGGKCAICRNRPKTKRLAVDHSHKTGEVRGLLCSRCNHDLMGAAWDSLNMAVALVHYINTPPTSGQWVPPENRPPLALSAPLAAERDELDLLDPDMLDDPTTAPVVPMTVEAAKRATPAEVMALQRYLEAQVELAPF